VEIKDERASINFQLTDLIVVVGLGRRNWAASSIASSRRSWSGGDSGLGRGSMRAYS
jgi:hypothetical protein